MMEEVPPRPIEALLVTLTSSRKLKLMIVSLVLLCSFLLTAINYIASTYGFASKKQKQETTEDSIIYGHVHVAKTVGSTLLDILAYRYERVCSNKANSILLKKAKREGVGECHTFHTPWDHRRDYLSRLDECDYVSQEGSYLQWAKQNWSKHLELHIPCKDPLELLMSACFYRTEPPGFDCSERIGKQVKRCLRVKNGISRRVDNRFDERLLRSALKHNFTVKCYNTDLTFSSYLPYMDQRLTPRNSTTIPNVTCDGNTTGRNRTSECIWQNETLKTQVKKYLLENHFYFAYCMQCLGSSDDLFQERA